MQKIRVFSFPSHSPGNHISAVDYPRVIQPMKFLHGYKDGEVEFEVVCWDGKRMSVAEWNVIASGIDILFFNYTLDDWAFASMGAMCRAHGVKMVMDIDDAVWRINPDNTVYDKYKKGSKGIAILTDIVNEVDYLTCTNSYLKNVLVDSTFKKHNKIGVFGNCVDLSLYNHVPDFKDTHGINIVHYGSSSHYSDLKDPEFQKGMDRIMYEYPNVTFLTVGSFFGELREKWGARYEEEFGALNFLDWAKTRFPEVMDKTDIFVAPLTENIYNRCKSDIKRSEVATAKKPFVGQNIRQYQEVITNGIDGFLCRRAEEWYQAIKTLIDDKQLRRKIGEEGYNRVLKTRQAKDIVKNYAVFLKEVLKANSLLTT